MAQSTFLAIDGGEVITPVETYRAACVLIKGARIMAVGDRRKIGIPKGAQVISVCGKRVLPGLIDTHLHGFAGSDCLGGVEHILQVRRRLVEYGVTGFLPTLFRSKRDSEENPAHYLSLVMAAARAPDGGAQVLGVHLEGPYFSPFYGAFSERNAPCLPAAKVQERMIRAAKGLVRIVTLSPEVKGAGRFIRRLTANGIVAAIGHSGATERQVREAVKAGASHVIHLFDAMRQRTQAELGVEGTSLSDLVLTDDRLTAEVIADGIHVCPVLLKLLVRAKRLSDIILVTDSTMIAGLPPGKHRRRDGNWVRVSGGACRTVRENGLCGSVLTLNRAVLNMTRLARVPFPSAVQMATLNPARRIGLGLRKGSIEPGKDADLCVVDGEMQVHLTIIKGRIVYSRRAKLRLAGSN
jgi:N-acetylglucosamine-6-phosphate deacetylase